MALVKYNNNSISAITAASSLTAGAMTLIKSQTASSSATISFVDGTSDVVLDSTYPIYKFVWINAHPSASGEQLSFQGNAAGGSGYNETITSSFFRAVHLEDGSDQTLAYVTGSDLAQATGFQPLTQEIKNDADSSASGELWLFNPSSTTLVKHFIAVSNSPTNGTHAANMFTAGYFNTTTALTRFQFKMDGGNIDSGVIKLYGIS